MTPAKNNIKLTDKVHRNKDLLSTDMDGETVMMSIENGEYYGLDSIASRIWELIEHPMEVRQLVVTLMDEYDVGKDECVSDTMGFLEQLLDKELLFVQPGQQP
jgi:hypothetical protein